MKTANKLMRFLLPGVVLAASGGLLAATVSDEHSDLEVQIEGPVAPGQELMVSANCQGLRGKAEASFGADAVMSPAADAPVLLGFLQIPQTLGPGPEQGLHTVTVTCDDGVTATLPLVK